jgi:hypothetical protein
MVFKFIKRHYVLYQEQVQLNGVAASEQTNLLVVPVARLDHATERALSFARSIMGEAVAIHVSAHPTAAEPITAQWEHAHCAIPLQVIPASSRSLTLSILNYLQRLGRENPTARIVVILPERAPHHFWGLFFHHRKAMLLKWVLLFQRNRIVVSVPYHEHAEHADDHHHSDHNFIVVPVARVDRATARTLQFARTIQGEVTAMFVAIDHAEGEQLRQAWQAAHFDVPLKLVDSPYRSVTGPLLKYLDRLSAEHPADNVVVVLPEIVPRRRRHLLLHNQTTLLVKLVCLLRPLNRILISVPYHLDR